MKHFLTLLILSCIASTGLAQETLILQHQKRKRKQKVFPIEKTFSFKINDSTYHYGQITDFDQESITITRSDSVTAKVRIGDVKDITRSKVANQRWMEPFAYFLIGAGMVVVATPLIWIADGGDKALEGLEFAGMLTAVSVPPLWYGSRQERYNLQKKWRLVVQDD